MFDIVSRLNGNASGNLQKAGANGAADSASAALYDQILRSVLQSLHVPEVAAESALPASAEPAQATAPSLINRTLEDVLAQRRFTCSLQDGSAQLPLEQIALYQQSLHGEMDNPLLREGLEPWEVLMGQLTFQQRLAA